ncbi:MAG: hypothetical protein LBS91_00905, partial [Clostridiales Family XIII bacterium]|nr:hypothetical protein [Clostridiales Family XIII bacterium]
CDHNHERRHALAGYEGVVNFTKEVHRSINNPVWRYMAGAAEESAATGSPACFAPRNGTGGVAYG